MSKHLGDYDASVVVYGKFSTYQPSTGATFTLGGTPALSVYKDNNATQSTSGVTLTANFDSVTGLNHFAIDTSSDGSFYSAGSFFDVVITTGTVDGISVTGSVVASFTIRRDSALKPTTAGRTLVVDSSGLADATAVKLGQSGSATAQTARDVGASVLLSSGTGTGQLDFTSGQVKVQSGTGSGQILTSSGKVSLVAADIGAVWDVTLASHQTSGSTGEALSAAMSGGDPWSTPLPGAYAAGTAGFILGTNLDAQVSAVPTDTENADALLKRDWSSVTGEADRSVLNALRVLRNRVAIVSTTLTVYKENGSTTAWNATLTTNPSASLIVTQTP